MKRKLNFILLIMFIIMFALTVKASAYSFTASMTPSNTQINEATEFTVTVKVSNLDVGDNGINSFSAFLSYDTNVFETLSDSSVEGLNSWIPKYATGTGKITNLKSSFVNSDEEIMQITLKTKSGLAENTKGTISLSNILASNSADDITASNISTTITVGTSGSVSVVPNNTTNNTANNTTQPLQIQTNTNNKTNNTVNNVTNNTSNNVTTNIPSNNSEQDIPYTGSESSSLSKIIAGVIIIALITYVKIEKMKDVK